MDHDSTNCRKQIEYLDRIEEVIESSIEFAISSVENLYQPHDEKFSRKFFIDYSNRKYWIEIASNGSVRGFHSRMPNSLLVVVVNGMIGYLNDIIDDDQ